MIPRMRIALIHIGQETNDFNPLPTTLRDYESFGIVEGRAIIDTFRGAGEIGGFVDAIERCGRDIEIVPIVRGWAVAGGRIDRESYEFFDRKIRQGLAAAGRVDALALQLHGACAADGIDDVEGAQLQACRDLLGPDVPIVLGLDHHGNVTRKMVSLCTAIVGHRTQPHDPYDTGRIEAELLLKILYEGARPVMAWRKLPLLSHQEQFLTAQGPMKVWFDRARALAHRATSPHRSMGGDVAIPDLRTDLARTRRHPPSIAASPEGQIDSTGRPDFTRADTSTIPLHRLPRHHPRHARRDHT